MANVDLELSSLLTSTAFGVAVNGINVNDGAGIICTKNRKCKKKDGFMVYNKLELIELTRIVRVQQDKYI